jgi:hypothetical protein
MSTPSVVRIRARTVQSTFGGGLTGCRLAESGVVAVAAGRWIDKSCCEYSRDGAGVWSKGWRVVALSMSLYSPSSAWACSVLDSVVYVMVYEYIVGS